MELLQKMQTITTEKIVYGQKVMETLGLLCQ